VVTPSRDNGTAAIAGEPCDMNPESVETERAPKPAPEAMVWDRVFYGREVIERILETIQVKDALRQRFLLRYTCRAAMAGVIVCLLYILSYQIKTDLGPGFNPALMKYLTGASFSMALAFIYFTNSELLTSNFMYFTVGLYYKKVSAADALRIWAVCLAGNLAGIVVVSALVRAVGQFSPAFLDNLIHAVQDKTVHSSGWRIFVEAIFCNYFINISVIIAMQVHESLTKLIVLMMGVTIFAYLGLEHVVANSALFIMALFHQPGAVDLGHTGKSFVCSLLGNYVGGGLVIGLFYAYLNDHRVERPPTAA
jgi:formate/nitrite transporter